MRYAAWIILSILTLGSLPAAAQDVRVLQDRLQRLESELVQLQRQVYRGGASGPPAGVTQAPVTSSAGDSSAYGQLLTRIDQLEDQLRNITGRLEQSENRNQQLQRRLDKLVEDIDFRFAQIEKRGDAGQPAAQPGAPAPLAPVPLAPGQSGQAAPAPTNAGPGAPPANLGTISAGAMDQQSRVAAAAPPAAAGKLPPGSTQERYNYAVKLLQQGDYADAEAAFTEFTTAHPNDPLTANAQYWVGETFFARNQFDRAAKAFLAGYQKYPKSPKAPDNLLKLSMSLTNLNQKQEACAVLKQLSTEFPNADAQNKQAAARERTRAACK